MALENLRNAPFDKNQLAVALSKSDFGAGHVGLAFHSVKDGPQVLHLAWHRLLEVDDIPGQLKFGWGASPIPIPQSASKQLVAIVRKIAVRRPAINYGISLLKAKGSFDQNGMYRAPKGSDGLTCSTFVVEVLRAGMVDLLKLEDWKETPENIAWGESVCKSLERTSGVDADHIASVRKNITGLRVRPFEVAGLATLAPSAWPASFDVAQSNADRVHRELEQVLAAA